jgi:hypothetical protein
MNRATPQMRSLAKQLVTTEALGRKSFETDAPAGFYVIDKLRPQLAMLMGDGGFRALLSRALGLAMAETPWLEAVRVNADGALEGFEALKLDRAQFVEGKVVVVAQLLGLLVAFIGPSLTMRLVSEIWPHIPFDDRDFGKETPK